MNKELKKKMAYFPTQKFKPFVFKKKKIINND